MSAQPRQPRTKKAAATLPPTNLERIIAEHTAKQRKAPKTPLQQLTKKAQDEQLEADYLASLPDLPKPQRQYTRLVPGRRYRADFCWLDARLIVEVDGSMWGRRNPQTGEWERGKAGGHTSGHGYDRDRRRDAECQLAGWTVLRVTADMIRDGSAADYTTRHYTMLAERKQQQGVA